MNPRIKLRHLSAFAEVARRRNITRAARTLCVTQAAVSRTLAELEKILDARLLRRGGPGVLLTPLGGAFLPHAEQVLAAVRRGEESVALAKERGGDRVVLGAQPSVAARIVPLAVREFMRENPDVIMRVVVGENSVLQSMLKVGELDLLVGRLTLSKDMAGVSFERLYLERLALVARPGHPALRKRGGRRRSQRQILTDVGGHVVVFPPPNTRLREDSERLFIQGGAPMPSRRAEINSPTVARALVLGGDAVWCVTTGVVEDDLKAGILEEIPADMRETSGAVGVSIRADIPPSPHCATLMEFVRKVVAGEKER